MGKSSLLMVLGMSIIVAFFILRLNANSTENVSVTSNMFQHTKARLIANSGVEVFLEKLKEDPTMMESEFPGNTLFGGTYDIIIEGPEECVQVTAIASFMGSTHTTVVEAQTDKLPVYHPPGAMYLSTSVLSNISMAKSTIKGGITIDGRDHTMNGDLVIPIAELIPGIAVDGPDQLAEALDMYNNMTGATILGLGGEPSIQIVADEINWAEYAQLFADNADVKLTNETINGSGPWGTLDDPQVTFLQGDKIKIDKSVSVGDTVKGCGVLVVDGSIEISSIMKFTGLIIAYKDATINIDLKARGKVIGGMVISGETVNLNAGTANFEILYSYAAVQNIAKLLKTRRFEILSWWE